MQLFYDPGFTVTSSKINLEKEESRHISKVLRKGIGDTIELTNGKGLMATAVISELSQKQCVLAVENVRNVEPLPYRLHLAVAPTKLNDRYEWFLEKATEIGVTEITPIICDHSERKVIKADRYERIVQSAMKQSLKSFLPYLHPITTFQQFIQKELDVDLKAIAHCEPTSKKSLKSILKKGQSICILIGPEGDFSSTEIDDAISSGYFPIHLGNSRLRTETAAVVACHSVAFINEN